jgi:hypothetical protein
MLSGGPAIRDNLMSRINNEFWPGAEIPHLRFNDIKAWKFDLWAEKTGAAHCSDAIRRLVELGQADCEEQPAA